MLGLVFLLHISLEYLRKMENGWVLLILEVFSLSLILISIESDVTSILLMLILEKKVCILCAEVRTSRITISQSLNRLRDSRGYNFHKYKSTGFGS